MRAGWMATLLVAALLAGCADDDGSNGSDELTQQALDDLDVEATATTGVIRGVVVDQAIRPVDGALVQVPQPGGAPALSMETDASGAFGFDGLQPGPYFLRITKVGYNDAQVSVDVVAGVDEPAAIKVLLEANPSAAPYVQLFTFNGFIECSTGVLAVCGLANAVGEIAGVGNLTNDHFLEVYEVDPGARFLQSEMVWQSTQAAFPNMYQDLYTADGDTIDSQINSTEGPSPLVITEREASIAAHGLGDTRNLMVRVFSAGIAEVTIQQEFEIFITLTHNFVPPAGWQFNADGAPVPPV
ncbi:MAG: carboxypeptidase-like regulatory domain-containing protein [Thermoplasmatota archaeon]